MIETVRGLLTGISVGDHVVLAIAWSVGIALVSHLWARRLFSRDPMP